MASTKCVSGMGRVECVNYTASESAELALTKAKRSLMSRIGFVGRRDIMMAMSSSRTPRNAC